MGLWGIVRRIPVQELSINGQSIDDNDDDFAVEDPEADTPDNPGDGAATAQANEAPTGNATADTPANANSTTAPDTTPAADQPGDDGEGIQDDFSLPDDDVGAGEEDPGNPPAPGEEGTGNDGEGIQDDFSMGDGAEEGTDDMGSDTATDTGGDLGNTSTGNIDKTSQEIKDNEAKLYETLSDDEKNQRILQLKNDFKSIYDQTDATINAVNAIEKNEDNIETLQRLINILNNMQKYVQDYLTMVFDKRSFMDNNAVHLKFAAMFDTIRKVIDELNKEQKSGGK
ncbi:hypothetical protein [Bacteroides acidifaciens]|uniref:hypothetical protein n=1 Tax=Bacteroides acidifaciens TaxID=85831 RepID=UPI00263B0977|nr:hypothetical protein [Bacteroides acidifaciens]